MSSVITRSKIVSAIVEEKVMSYAEETVQLNLVN